MYYPGFCLGLSKNSFLRETLVFKGGTVLKKAYFDDYRFSEDLDFTLLQGTCTNDQILDAFHSLFEFVKEASNIDLRIDPKKSKQYGSLQFYIDYVAPLKGSLGSRDLKIDITRGEILETPVETISIFRNYSDLSEDFTLYCYSLAEVLIEKLVALIGRTEPRDLYDIWYLTEVAGLKVSDVWSSFLSKAINKGQDPNRIKEVLLKKETAFRRDWDKKLAAQIHDLPDYERVYRGVKRQISF